MQHIFEGNLTTNFMYNFLTPAYTPVSTTTCYRKKELL